MHAVAVWTPNNLHPQERRERADLLLSRRARARRTDGAPKIIWREIAAYASASKKLATDDDDETTNDGTPTTRGGNPGALVNLFEG